MVDVESIKNWLVKAAPRISKAIIKGLFWFILLYAIPVSIISMSGIPIYLFPEYLQLLGVFAGVTVIFVVVSELLAKTVFQHVFNIAKAIVLMVFLVCGLNGGFLTIDFEGIHVAVDLRLYLGMLLTINFLGLAKSALQALNFLSERTETSQALKQE